MSTMNGIWITMLYQRGQQCRKDNNLPAALKNYQDGAKLYENSFNSSNLKSQPWDCFDAAIVAADCYLASEELRDKRRNVPDHYKEVAKCRDRARSYLSLLLNDNKPLDHEQTQRWLKWRILNKKITSRESMMQQEQPTTYPNTHVREKPAVYPPKEKPVLDPPQEKAAVGDFYYATNEYVRFVSETGKEKQSYILSRQSFLSAFNQVVEATPGPVGEREKVKKHMETISATSRSTPLLSNVKAQFRTGTLYYNGKIEGIDAICLNLNKSQFYDFKQSIESNQKVGGNQKHGAERGGR